MYIFEQGVSDGEQRRERDMRVHGAPEHSRVPVPSVTSQTMKPGIPSAAAASSWPSGLQLSAVTRHLS